MENLFRMRALTNLFFTNFLDVSFQPIFSYWYLPYLYHNLQTYYRLNKTKYTLLLFLPKLRNPWFEYTRACLRSKLILFYLRLIWARSNIWPTWDSCYLLELFLWGRSETLNGPFWKAWCLLSCDCIVSRTW